MVRRVKGTNNKKSPNKKVSVKNTKRELKSGGSPVTIIPALLKSNKMLQLAPTLINTLGALGTKREIGKMLSRASEQKLAERSKLYSQILRENLRKAKPVIGNRVNNISNKGDILVKNVNKLFGNKSVLNTISGLSSIAQNLKANLANQGSSQQDIVKYRQAELLEQQRKQAELLEQQRKQAELLEQQRKQAELLEQQRKQAELLEQQRRMRQELENEKIVLLNFLKELRKTRISMVKIERALIEMRQTGSNLSNSEKQNVCLIYKEISDKVLSQCNQPFINNPAACVERSKARFGINETVKQRAVEILDEYC